MNLVRTGIVKPIDKLGRVPVSGDVCDAWGETEVYVGVAITIGGIKDSVIIVSPVSRGPIEGLISYRRKKDAANRINIPRAICLALNIRAGDGLELLVSQERDFVAFSQTKRRCAICQASPADLFPVKGSLLCETCIDFIKDRV